MKTRKEKVQFQQRFSSERICHLEMEEKKRSHNTSPKFILERKRSYLRRDHAWKRKKKRHRHSDGFFYNVYDWDPGIALQGSPGNQLLVTGECCSSCVYEEMIVLQYILNVNVCAITSQLWIPTPAWCGRLLCVLWRIKVGLFPVC